MALASGASVDTFVDSIFNFPTLAEAYRVAALDVQRQALIGSSAFGASVPGSEIARVGARP